MLQQGGLPLAAAYGLFVASLLAVFVRHRCNSAEPLRAVLGAGVVTIIGGLLLSYGHFFLLHIQSSQAPVGHWNWYIIGLGVGASMANELRDASTRSALRAMHLEPARTHRRLGTRRAEFCGRIVLPTPEIAKDAVPPWHP